MGAALWKTRPHSEDLLFGELMLWGWVQRWRIERRLAAATDLLGLSEGVPRNVPGGRLTDEQRADLLTQLASTLEARDPYTHGHSRRVARHSSNIAKRMGLSAEEVAKVRTAAAMHDVGKVKTPIAVLHKEGKLTDEEFAIIKRHPGEGAVMVAMLRDDELTAMVRHHHERLDATGYPDRLAGEAIPVGARIIAVADTFDAIISTRAYRSARAHKRALDILDAEAGTQLDPDAVKAFCRCYSGMRPLAVWTLLAGVPQRLVSWFGNGLGTANAASMVNVMATATTTAIVGGAVLGSLAHPPAHSHRTVRIAAGESTALATAHRSESPRPARHERRHAASHRTPPTSAGILRAPASTARASAHGPSARRGRVGLAPSTSPQPATSPRRPRASVRRVHERTGDPIRVGRGAGHDGRSSQGTGTATPTPGTGLGSGSGFAPIGPAPAPAPDSGNASAQQAPGPPGSGGRGHRRGHRHRRHR